MKQETTKEFYCRVAKEQEQHAAILKEMYVNRKIKGTALADAIWAGHYACKEKAEDYALKSEQIPGEAA